MAKQKKASSKKPQTVREQAKAAQERGSKPRRLKQTASTSKKPLRSAFHFGKKEYFIPLPNNRFGKFLNKKRHIIPTYFRDSWKELKQVTWPDRKQTTRLSIAVVVFAIVFSVLIAIVDYGLDKIFRAIIL